jgi:transposase
MVNVLKMAIQQTLTQLLELGWSHRQIARELDIDRGTVSKYDQIRKTENSKPAIVHAGSGEIACSEPAIVPTGSIAGRPSQCEPFRDIFTSKLEKGLTAQRIWQDLKEEHDFSGAYDSVKRFVKRLGKNTPLPFRRMECLPGKEAQVDFGTGAWIIENGKKRRSHVFRITLSHSRKSYSEAVFKQGTENFIRCIENAFWYFGGVPETIVLDNLKAAVTNADWYDPELNPKILDFAKHYGCAFLPTKPYMPRHKGKVESGVKYVKENALKGRIFNSLQAENDFLLYWEKNIADNRIHGTTKKQVQKLFIEAEKASLNKLSAERFPYYRESWRSVHRDGHVEVVKSYYSVPPEFLGHKVFVRWDSRLVRIYNKNFNQISVHAKVEPGRFSTSKHHLADAKISSIERGAEYLLEKACKIGFASGRWAKTMLDERGIEGVRVLQGLIALSSSYPSHLINQACDTFYHSNSFRLRPLREWINRNKNQKEFEFCQVHPLIRPLSEYQNLINISFRKQNQEETYESTTY